MDLRKQLEELGIPMPHKSLVESAKELGFDLSTVDDLMKKQVEPTMISHVDKIRDSLLGEQATTYEPVTTSTKQLSIDDFWIKNLSPIGESELCFGENRFGGVYLNGDNYELKFCPNEETIFELSMPDRLTGKREVACTLKRWGTMQVPTKWRKQFDDLALRFLGALAHFCRTLPLPVSPKQEAIIKFCQEHKLCLADFDAQYVALPGVADASPDLWCIVPIEDLKQNYYVPVGGGAWNVLKTKAELAQEGVTFKTVEVPVLTPSQTNKNKDMFPKNQLNLDHLKGRVSSQHTNQANEPAKHKSGRSAITVNVQKR